MPSGVAAVVAVAIAVAVAFGRNGAVLGRARRDHAAAKAGADRAWKALMEAFWGFAGVVVLVVMLVASWMHHH